MKVLATLVALIGIVPAAFANQVVEDGSCIFRYYGHPSNFYECTVIAPYSSPRKEIVNEQALSCQHFAQGEAPARCLDAG